MVLKYLPAFFQIFLRIYLFCKGQQGRATGRAMVFRQIRQESEPSASSFSSCHKGQPLEQVNILFVFQQGPV